MRILFLSNNEISNSLINWLKKIEKEVIVYSRPLEIEFLKEINPSIIISYNYKFIIKEEIIDYMKDNIVNLHISFLPWNRGRHPNLWSFLEDTPKGVTIHIIDKGIDTGPILIQKRVYINEDVETLKSSYEILHKEIQDLFKNNWQKIKNKELKPLLQSEGGSFHTTKDFERIKHLINDKGWNITVKEFKRRYKNFIKETQRGECE